MLEIVSLPPISFCAKDAHNYNAPFLPTDSATQSANCSDGDLRLTGGATSNQGRLEVCLNGAWGSVCDSRDSFTTAEAKAACRQLGLLQVEGEREVHYKQQKLS